MPAWFWLASFRAGVWWVGFIRATWRTTAYGCKTRAAHHRALCDLRLALRGAVSRVYLCPEHGADCFHESGCQCDKRDTLERRPVFTLFDGLQCGVCWG